MKILFCCFGGLGENAIARAFKRMNYQVIEFSKKAENYDYDQEYMNALIDKMQQEQCDIVFSINFLPLISKTSKVFRTLYVSWIYDCPELHLYSSAVQNENNRIFLFDQVQYAMFSPLNPEGIFYMPLASEPMEHFPIREEQIKYASDICFIGSLYNEKKKRFHQMKELPDYLRGYAEGLCQAQLNVFGYNFIRDSLSDDVVKEFKKHLDWKLIDDYMEDDKGVLADMYLGPYCSALDRQRTLQELSSEWKITLYTDSDISNLKNVDNRGIADSETMMPKIFHCSKINLNITSKTIQTGLPLRIFDVLANKGFLITNYQAEIMEYFEPGVDLVVYESIEDLKEKVRYYLNNDEERCQIAENGYQKVKRFYTYDIVLNNMFKMCGLV